MQEMVIYGVSFDMVGKQPIVLLKTADGNKFLPIWIGHPEAASILMKLQGATTPRPMTHDLLCDILGELDVRCTQVAVTELRDNTFFAQITIRSPGSELEIDSRPSDAIALAVRVGAPIYAAEEVIADSAIEFEARGRGHRLRRREVQRVPRPGHARGLRRSRHLPRCRLRSHDRSGDRHMCRSAGPGDPLRPAACGGRGARPLPPHEDAHDDVLEAQARRRRRPAATGSSRSGPGSR